MLLRTCVSFQTHHVYVKAACITQTRVRAALGREEMMSRAWQYRMDRKLNHERGNLEGFMGGRMDRFVGMAMADGNVDCVGSFLGPGWSGCWDWRFLLILDTTR
ncbi:hypothetical protein DUNSADRAFT_12923 [Dunaliella salina]|uniref:Encoded protein n=1 Tax=Dunaliella salina TaxID=3046 RepID=A0ABQ7GAF6_DUNSA|nr:hypothetical protein DUNSADRAFT_12923 [Dunaliella salina]|eukprot:KAF5831589.1 hypothetical protein DUNSADRAFT_12923 [Dunaliella salina]